MYLGEPGRSSVGSFYEIWKDGRKFADGAAKIVWIDLASGRSTPLPERDRGAAARARGRRGSAGATRCTMTAKLWEPPPSASPRRTSPRSRASVERAHGDDVRRLRQRSGAGRTRTRRSSGATSGRRRRDRRRAASACSSTATGCPARDGFPMRGSTSRRTCSSGGRAGDAGDALVFWGEDKVKRRVSHARGARVGVAASRRRWRRDGLARRRPRRRVHAEHARDDHRDARRGGAGRHLVVVLARLRRAGRARPLRPDRAARAVHRRRLLVQRQADRDPRQGRRDRRASCRRSSASSSCPISQQGIGGAERVSAASRRLHVGRVHRAVRRRADRVRAAAVRSSALHPVLVGHDRRAEVHRARRRRNAAAAPEGAPAARRREARRPAVLLHDLRLDDVELARVRARGAARRCCCSTARRSSTRGRVLWELRGRGADDALRHVGQVHRRAEEGRAGAGARTTRSKALRTMFSTGSPLAPESFDYVYEAIKHDICLSSISGGTDIV